MRLFCTSQCAPCGCHWSDAPNPRPASAGPQRLGFSAKFCYTQLPLLRPPETCNSTMWDVHWTCLSARSGVSERGFCSNAYYNIENHENGFTYITTEKLSIK